MKKMITTTILGILFSSSVALAAEDQKSSKYGLTGKLGTLGAGLDLTYKLRPKLNIRANLNGASTAYNETDDGITYDGDLKLASFGGLLDYHPRNTGFRVSAGLYSNSNRLEASAKGSGENLELGDGNYQLTNGELNSSVDFKSIAPYLGIGWGNAVQGNKQRWRFAVDLGVLFQGAPTPSLSASGNALDIDSGLAVNLANDPTVQVNLRQEERNLENDLKDFKVYPVVSLGVSYNF